MLIATRRWTRVILFGVLVALTLLAALAVTGPGTPHAQASTAPNLSVTGFQGGGLPPVPPPDCGC